MNISNPGENCLANFLSRYLFTAWFTVYLLLLPVFLLVLYIGFNKWKKPQSSASRGLSHSDVFTVNMVAMEIICIAGSCVRCFGYYSLSPVASSIGRITVTATTSGQVLFHSLTCVERYLAVVHPVTYLKMRGEGGVTVRNISIALIWVFSVTYCLLLEIITNPLFFVAMSFFLAVTPLPLVAYCSIYVLCILMRPKPGAVGGQRKQIDQSKRSTVNTMAAILAALLLRLLTDAVYNITYFLPRLTVDKCALAFLSLWSTLPSSLVLPLLFLQRAGKLKGCNRALC